VPTLERYRSINDLPPTLAVFPLRGVILLPRSQLPFNVFEPRYLDMVDDVLSGSRLIGMIQPDAAEGSVESPKGRDVALKRVGCAGRVTAYQELEDGRRLITLSGIARFSLKSEIDNGKAYRTFGVDYGAYGGDLAPEAATAELDRDKLLRVLRAYLDAHRLKADWKAIAAAPSEQLINALCVSSPFGPEEKQALLEAPTVVARAEVLMALAEMDIAAGGSGGGATLQ
jgi:Lon protease-like protein